MDKDTAIKVEHLSKTFRIPHEKVSSLRGLMMNIFRINHVFGVFVYHPLLSKGLNKSFFSLDWARGFWYIGSTKTTRTDSRKGTWRGFCFLGLNTTV